MQREGIVGPPAGGSIDQIKRNAVNQEGVFASLAKFRSLYQTLPPY
jgi:hypothetical protein